MSEYNRDLYEHLIIEFKALDCLVCEYIEVTLNLAMSKDSTLFWFYAREWYSATVLHELLETLIVHFEEVAAYEEE